MALIYRRLTAHLRTGYIVPLLLIAFPAVSLQSQVDSTARSDTGTVQMSRRELIARRIRELEKKRDSIKIVLREVEKARHRETREEQQHRFETAMDSLCSAGTRDEGCLLAMLELARFYYHRFCFCEVPRECDGCDTGVWHECDSAPGYCAQAGELYQRILARWPEGWDFFKKHDQLKAYFHRYRYRNEEPAYYHYGKYIYGRLYAVHSILGNDSLTHYYYDLFARAVWDEIDDNFCSDLHIDKEHPEAISIEACEGCPDWKKVDLCFLKGAYLYRKGEYAAAKKVLNEFLEQYSSRCKYSYCDFFRKQAAIFLKAMENGTD